MAKYLLQVSYTASGAQGVMKEGGSSRRDLIAKLTADAGGTLDEFYFAFGEDDVICIVDAPDHATMAAFSMTVGASGRRVREDDGAAHAGRDRSSGQPVDRLPGSGSVARS